MDEKDTSIPFYKKWWFGALVTFVIMLGVMQLSNKEVNDSLHIADASSPQVEVTPETTQSFVQEAEETTEAEMVFELSDLMRDTPEETMKAVIKQDAKDNWGTDYEMVRFQYENQVESFDNLMHILRDSELKGTVDEEIIEEALITWGTDFDMVMFEYESQLEAWKELNNND